MVDGIVDMNELVGLVEKTNKGCLIFKVDLEKVYDSISWSVLMLFENLANLVNG